MKMDVNDVKACLRALLTSSVNSYSLNLLLRDFRITTGFDLPLFGYRSPLEFLSSLNDTIQLLGSHYNPTVCLVESKKSAHISSLVDRQKRNSNSCRPRRIILPCTYNEGSQCNGTAGKPYNYMPNTRSSPRGIKSSSTSVVKRNLTPLASERCSQYTNGVPVEKSNCDYFEDISDDETWPICSPDSTTNSDQAVIPSNTSINIGIKDKLTKLIKSFPDGLWCCELPHLFLQKFNLELDYREYGYTSLIQMLSEMPDVFRCARPGNEDWILFDASLSPSAEKEKIKKLLLTRNSAVEIKERLGKLLRSPDHDTGVDLDSISDLYQKMFGSSLNFESLGFKDLKSFLETFKGSLLEMYEISGKIIVVPAVKLVAESSIRWKEAVPPITAESDIFVEIFPKDVVGPNERLVELDLTRHLAVGHRIEICVAEVWSPGKFYIQMHKFKSLLNRFMDDLQKFYNVHFNKYKMPESTIRPKQLCVGLYNSDPDYPEEWHRARIVKVINEKTVLINFVDFGTETRVKKNQLRFLHRIFQNFPIQAFLAKLSGISPLSEDNKWPEPVSKKFLEFLRVPYLEAEMVEIDFKKPSMSIVLFDTLGKSIVNINQKLVEINLAKFKKTESDGPFEIEESLPEKERKDLETSKNNSVETPGSQSKEELDVTYEFVEVEDLKETVNKTNEIQEKTLNEVFEIEEDFALLTTSTPLINAKEPKVEKPKPQEMVEHLPGRPLLLPPGLEKVKGSLNFNQIKSLMMEKEEVKKRINLLSLELLTSKPSIKQVAVTNPELALKIATEMAEAYVASEYSNKLSTAIWNTLAHFLQHEVVGKTASAEMERNEVNIQMSSVLSSVTEDVQSVTVEKDESPATSTVVSPDSSPSGKPTTADPISSVEITEKSLGGKMVHLIKLEDGHYVCAEEIVRLFTLISNWEIADRVLQAKKVKIRYKIVDKADENIMKALKRFSIQGVFKKRKKKIIVCLLPFDEVVPFLIALGCQTKSYEKDFMDLMKTF